MSVKHTDALDLDKLEALARAATPGPWEATHQTDDECSHAGYFIEAVGKTISDDGTAPGDKDALFIAEANPATVLTLIAKIRATEGQAQTSAATESKQAGIKIGLVECGAICLNVMEDDTIMRADEGTEIQHRILSAIHAAQLADSTEPGAPVAWSYECLQPHTKPGIWCEFLSRDKPCEGPKVRNVQPLYAAPTAQQSFTAGGAVPELSDAYLLDALHRHGFFPENLTGQAKLYSAIREIVGKIAAAPLPQVQSEAARDVLAERLRQVEAEGYRADHDDGYHVGTLAQAAACYAYPELVDVFHGLNAWPWDECFWKPRDPRRNYVRAAALLLAEIERIDRATDQQPVTPSGALADNDGGVAN